MVFVEGETKHTVRNVPTPKVDRERFCINDEDALELADYAIKIERHYGRPMDMEWAKDGLDGQLYLLQVRPETVALSARPPPWRPTRSRPTGQRCSPRGVRREDRDGPSPSDRERQPAVRVRGGRGPGVRHNHAGLGAGHEAGGGDRHQPRRAHLPRGDHRPRARRAGRGGLRRRYDLVPSGETVTVSCAEGDTGRIYRGEVPFDVDRTEVEEMERPATEIMINLGNPDLAFKTSVPAQRRRRAGPMEFITGESIKAHPLALIHPEQVTDLEARNEISRLTRGYLSGEAFFVERLSEGIGTIGAAFWPKPVVADVRLQDERVREPARRRRLRAEEENPMIGFRGASRYAHPAYEEGFALECEAMKRVREEMGLTNVVLMIPFVRRVNEAEKVLERMAELGLRRGENGLKVYVRARSRTTSCSSSSSRSCSTASRSYSNDLTQLTLGVDRDSEIVAFDYDERDDGVKEMLRLAVDGCRRPASICQVGRRPPTTPDMAEYLVELGIDSISLNPDTVIKTTKRILEMEKRLVPAGAS